MFPSGSQNWKVSPEVCAWVSVLAMMTSSVVHSVFILFCRCYFFCYRLGGYLLYIPVSGVGNEGYYRYVLWVPVCGKYVAVVFL